LVLTKEEREAFVWAEKAAMQKEREGLYWLAMLSKIGVIGDGDGHIDHVKAEECFRVAAELGFVPAMCDLGLMFTDSNPQKYVWLGKAAAFGESYWFSSMFSRRVNSFFNFELSGSCRVVFAIGRALKGNVNFQKRQIFSSSFEFDGRIGCAVRALHFYESQLIACRRAVDMWTLVGMRNRVVKDVRNVIGRMIWCLRDEANYFITKEQCILILF
jgi:hypothetical protein